MSYSELPLYNDDNKTNFVSGRGYSSTIGVAMYFRNSFIKGSYPFERGVFGI